METAWRISPRRSMRRWRRVERAGTRNVVGKTMETTFQGAATSTISMVVGLVCRTATRSFSPPGERMDQIVAWSVARRSVDCMPSFESDRLMYARTASYDALLS